MPDNSSTDPARMEKIVSLCKRKGFVFQSAEIYGGLNGCWDYGPVGAELKRNIKDYWWKRMVRDRDDVVGMDGAILTHREVLVASGHVGGFSDPLATCKQCKKHIRFDQLRDLVAQSEWARSLAEVMEVVTPGDPAGVRVESETLLRWVRKKGKRLAPGLALVRNPEVTLSWLAEEVERHQPLDPWYFTQLVATEQLKQTGAVNPCPHCGGELTEPREFDLMFSTHMGAVKNEENIAYLRPETAQTIFTQFKNVCDQTGERVKLPFGIAQIGKAFRNEINPRNFTFRSREFEQMEIEYFCREEDGLRLTDEWLEARLSWYEEIGLPRDKLHVLDVPDGERAHYSKKTYDIEYAFPFGIQELEGVAYRTDYDLGKHSKACGKDQDYFDEETRERFIPHVVEPSAGADRTVLAVLCEAYDEETLTDDKGKQETRTVMRFAPRIAPIKVAILPLLKNKPELVEKARAVEALLRPHMQTAFDVTGAIGRRYRRQDEVGTPFCVTIDFETIGESENGSAEELVDTVTLRERDSMQQERIAIADLLARVLAAIA
jgi:glycyl-tRNA synthetase